MLKIQSERQNCNFLKKMINLNLKKRNAVKTSTLIISAGAYVFMFAHYVNLWQYHFSHSERATEQ